MLSAHLVENADAGTNFVSVVYPIGRWLERENEEIVAHFTASADPAVQAVNLSVWGSIKDTIDLVTSWPIQVANITTSGWTNSDSVYHYSVEFQPYPFVALVVTAAAGTNTINGWLLL